jgi:hypothetical protein
MSKKATSELDVSLDELVQATNYILSSQLQEFIGEVDSITTYDKNGRKYLKVRVIVNSGVTKAGEQVSNVNTTIVYPPTYVSEFAKRLKSMGFNTLGEVINHKFQWKVLDIGVRNAFPRHLPIKLADKEEASTSKKPTTLLDKVKGKQTTPQEENQEEEIDEDIGEE